MQVAQIYLCGAFKDCQKCLDLFLFLKTLTLFREWNPAEAALIVWERVRLRLFVQQHMGSITTGRERGAMVGKSPTATKLMLLTVVWGAAALTSSQTSFTDSIVLVALTEKETLGGINKVSSPIFPEQSLSFILLLYYYFCQVYTDMWRGSFGSVCCLSEKKVTPQKFSLLLFILQWSYQKEQEYSFEHPVMKNNLQEVNGVSASRSHRRRKCI